MTDRKDTTPTTGPTEVGEAAASKRLVQIDPGVLGEVVAAGEAVKPSSRKQAGPSFRRVVFEAERLERLIERLGNNKLAKLMSVSPSQPSRWRTGEEGIGLENRRRLIDLDYVFGRLEQLFTPRQAEIWLTSSNSHLSARPIDVLRVRGAAPVIAAIDAEAEGAFA